MISEVIDSPFSDGKAHLQRKGNTLPFRKSDFEIVEHFYVCADTKEEFTTAELDKVNLNQVYNQYRDRFGLPFPDQIKRIREKYDLSAAKISEILGLGVNTYRLYEQGEIPSVGNGRLIMAAEDPIEFKKFLMMSREVIGVKDFEKISRTVEVVSVNEQNTSDLKYRSQSLFNRLIPDQFTGYRIPSLEKIAHMIMFFSSDSHTWKTKLNKLFFYCDFLAFKNSGFGISGLDYRAITYGPAPSQYDEMYKAVGEGELVKVKHEESGGYEGSYFEPRLTFNELLFDQFELEIMKKVSSEFKYLNATEITNLSHKELAWVNNSQEKKLISYKDFAFHLKAI
jgi:transcriptional regulator with XRE-family HTH domain